MNISENLLRILQDKADIANAILEKGVDCSALDSLDLFADKIKQISGGGKEEPTDFSDSDPVTFVSLSDGGIGLFTEGNVTDKEFYYKINNVGDWQLLEENNIINLEKFDYIQFKCNDSTISVSTSENQYRYFRMIGYFKSYGTLNSLINRPENNLHHLFVFYKLFSNCLGLLNSPKLPWIDTAYNCYLYMFENCSSLILAPELPAPIVLSLSYDHMFSGCSNLVYGPDLPAYYVLSKGYSAMFNNCHKLIGSVSNHNRYDLRAVTTMTVNCCLYMFRNCKSMTMVPYLPNVTTLVNYCYYYMFDGCSSLTSVYTFMNGTEMASYSCAYMYSNCTGLTDIDSECLDGVTKIAGYCYLYMFYNCSNLISGPSSLGNTNTVMGYCCDHMFYYCSSLTNVPDLSKYTTLAAYCYLNMFLNCSSLIEVPILTMLNATTLATGCYLYMFYGCSSLKSAPNLPATTLVSNCYRYMFLNCSKLNYIKAMFTTTPSASYTNSWVSGVSSTGTFIKNSAATWNVSGVNGIPSGWTVKTAAA